MSVWLQVIVAIAIIFMITLLITFIGFITICFIDYLKTNKKKGKEIMKTKLTINDVKILLNNGILVQEFDNPYFRNLPQLQVKVPYDKSKEKCLLAHLKSLGYKYARMCESEYRFSTEIEHFLLFDTRRPIGQEVWNLTSFNKKYRDKEYIYISDVDRLRL